MLTRDDIEAIRRTGRDEVARSTTIGLAELDALCDMALQALPQATGAPLSNTECYDKLDAAVREIHGVEAHLSKKGVLSAEFRKMIEFLSFHQFPLSMFTLMLQPRRRPRPEPATVGSMQVLPTLFDNVEVGCVHNRERLTVQRGDVENLIAALRKAVYED